MAEAPERVDSPAGPEAPSDERTERTNGRSSGGGTATATRTKPNPTGLLPPYRVLLHNDDVNDMVDVVDSIVMLTPLARERAVDVMLEAHRRGLSLLLVTHKERAELYCEQFASVNLTVTIEQVES